MDSQDFQNQVMLSLGRIEQKVDGHSQWMASHVDDDKRMADDIVKLKEGAARQRGVLAALTGVGSVLGAGVGYAVDLFFKGGHH